jgi:hypothetical protein
MNTFLYRIEHPYDKKGIWRSGDDTGFDFVDNHSCSSNIYKTHTIKNGFPTLMGDDDLWDMLYDHRQKGKGTKNFKFAYNCMDKVMEALTKDELLEFIECGFIIYRLEVLKCYSSLYQSVFEEDNIFNSVVITEEVVSLY